jgi:hypothetical protein
MLLLNGYQWISNISPRGPCPLKNQTTRVVLLKMGDSSSKNGEIGDPVGFGERFGAV